jgi:hypothetical protein
MAVTKCMNRTVNGRQQQLYGIGCSGRCLVSDSTNSHRVDNSARIPAKKRQILGRLKPVRRTRPFRDEGKPCSRCLFAAWQKNEMLRTSSRRSRAILSLKFFAATLVESPAASLRESFTPLHQSTARELHRQLAGARKTNFSTCKGTSPRSGICR